MKKIISAIIAMTMVLSLFVPVQAAEETYTVAFIGGSFTEGTGADATDDRYVNRVTTWMTKNDYASGKTINLVNAGIGGTTSLYGRLRFEKDVLAHNPDMIFIEFGGNDSSDVADWQNSMLAIEGMIRTAVAENPNVKMALVFRPDANGLRGAKPYQKIIADYYGIPVIDSSDVWGSPVDSAYVASDGTHPNSEGHKAIADYINAYLAENPILPPVAKINPYMTNYKPSVNQYYDAATFLAEALADSEKNTGFTKDGTSIKSSTPGDSITFTVKGSTLGIIGTSSAQAGAVTVVDSTGETLKGGGITKRDSTYPLYMKLDLKGESTVTIKNGGSDLVIESIVVDGVAYGDATAVENLERIVVVEDDFSDLWAKSETEQYLKSATTDKGISITGTIAGILVDSSTGKIRAITKDSETGAWEKAEMIGDQGNAKYTYTLPEGNYAFDGAYVRVKTNTKVSDSEKQTGYESTNAAEWMDWVAIDADGTATVLDKVTVIDTTSGQSQVVVGYRPLSIPAGTTQLQLRVPTDDNGRNNQAYIRELQFSYSTPATESIAIDFADTMIENKTAAVTVNSVMSDGTATAISANVTSNNEEILTVAEDGTVTANAAGTAYLTATAEIDGTTYTAQKKVRVLVQGAEDTEPNEKPASVWTSANAIYQENNGDMAKATTGSSSAYKIYSMTPRASTAPTGKQWHNFSGQQFRSRVGDGGTIVYNLEKFEAGKTYVYRVGVKNLNPEVEAYYGLAYRKTTTQNFDNGVATNYWGMDGMPVTATDDYQTFQDTITIIDDWTGENVQSMQQMHQGFSYLTPLNAKIEVNITTDYRYFAEEAVYDLTVTANNGTELGYGEELSFDASVLNQLEFEGTLDQTVTWKVMNADRTEDVDGFTVTDGKLSALEGTESGTYNLIAISEAYDLVQGIEFTLDNSEPVSYEDTAAVEMPENLMTNASPLSGTNSGDVGVSCDSTKTIYKRQAVNAKSWQIFPGTVIAATSSTSLTKFAAGKTYVMKTQVRNASADSTLTPYFGVGYAGSNTGTYSQGVGTNEYAKTGMPVTSTDWMDFKVTLSFASTWNENSTNTLYGQVLHFGMGYDSPLNSIIEAKTSKSDLYLAEEIPYDISFTADNGNILTVGMEADFSGEVVNQIGIPGTLTQDIEWAVVNTARDTVIDTIDVAADGGNVTLTVNEGTEAGTYALVAISEANEITKGYEIEVVEDLSTKYRDTAAVAIPENLITSEQVIHNQSAGEITRVNTATTETYTMTADGSGKKIWNTFLGSSMSAKLNKGEYMSIDYFAKDTTYVYSAKVKNASTDTSLIPYYGVAYNASSYSNSIGTNEYGKTGMAVTSTDWMDFKATLTFGADWDETNTSAMNGQVLQQGMGDSSPVDSALTVSKTLDDLYLAVEKEHDIAITPLNGAVLISGSSTSFKGEVVNQIGIPGTLTQDIEWILLNEDRTEVAVGIEKSVSDNTITLTCPESIETGSYTLVATSEEYGFVKGITLDVTVDPSLKYADYVVGDKPANLWRAHNALFGYGSGDISKSSSDATRTYTMKDVTEHETVFQGDRFNSATGADGTAEGYESWLKTSFESGKTYVYQVGVTTTTPDLDAYYGISYRKNTSGGYANGAGSDTYGKVGMKVTATDGNYQLFQDTISLPSDWGGDNVTAMQSMYQGLGNKTVTGASITVNAGSAYRYFAEEAFYNISNTALAGTEIVKGENSIDFESEIVNQLEIQGTLNQEVTWVALSADRTEEVSGFTFTENSDGTVTVDASSAVAAGEYVIVAYSDEYNAAKGVTITVSEKPEVEVSNFGIENIDDDGNWVYMYATVNNADCDTIMFAIAGYVKEEDGGLRLNKIKVANVAVVDGCAEVGELWLDEEESTADGTIVKAFVWDADTLKPLAESKKLVIGEADILTVYASADADENGEGTAASPLSLEAAKAKVAAEKANYTEGAEVVLLDGEYRLTETLAFTSADSGVTYRAAGDAAEIKGSAVIDTTKIVEITDTRVQEAAAANIVAIDISEYSSLLRTWSNIDSEKSLANGEMNVVYVDGAAQELAQWPNGDTYATFAATSAGNNLVYTDAEPDNWANATNYWLGGYFEYDYSYSRKSVESIDTANKTITLYKNENSVDVVGDNGLSNRYKAFNLLEELDAEGEYYIDTDNAILYLYREGGIEGAEIELSLANSALVSVTGTADITFDGINFSQARGDAVYMNDVNNIDFTGCSFTDIASEAIFTPYENNVTTAETDADYWQVQPLDVANNCDITGCDFENIGSAAIVLYGGNVDTLTASGNTISDNKITTVAQLAKNSSAIRMGGVGNTVSNNEISDAPFQAITHFGNDHVISYNNIHHVITEADDAAAIYCGRNALQRGTVIENNYIHDLKPTGVVRGFNSAIYWDDQVGGITAKNNIIENVNIGIIVNGGVDNLISGNVFINVQDSCTDSNKTAGAVAGIKTSLYICANGGTDNTFSTTSLATTKDLYFSEYPNLKTLLGKNLDNDLSGTPDESVYNTISNNTIVSGSNGIDADESYSIVSGTVTAESYDASAAVTSNGIGLITAR